MLPQVLTLLASLVLAGCLAADGTTPRQTGGNSPDWLAGCWLSADGSTTEHWTRAAPGWLFGFNTASSDGEIVFFEQLRIEPGPGGPVLQAYPAGRGPTAFPMVAAQTGMITFANASHDFPQRISYHRDGDRLTATVALMDGSKSRDWRFESCD